MLECISCGRSLTNDPKKPNAAEWTYASEPGQSRWPYCADSEDCRRDAEGVS